MEAKLLNGTAKQYHALDEAIRTAQFVRNKCVRYWMDNKSVNKAVLYAYCQDLAKEFDFVRKLDPAARQASAERAWASISRFHTDCRNNAVRKGYPQFKKNCRSVEYKLSGWKLSPDGMSITFTDGFNAGTFALYGNGEAGHHIPSFKINRVQVIRRADGYYARFCLDVEPKEQGAYTGNVIGIDLPERQPCRVSQVSAESREAAKTPPAQVEQEVQERGETSIQERPQAKESDQARHI